MTAAAREDFERRLTALLDALRARPSTETVTNPYRGNAGRLRLGNLRRYLESVAAHGPPLALVGEAPGYRGCAVTGVPLTSRQLFTTDLGRWGLFAGAGFVAEEALGAPWAEASATVVWRSVAALLPAPPLLANAFPFHPHPPGNRAANRPLRAGELAEGRAYLAETLALFPRITILAMGRQAARALHSLGAQPLACLRHPAHGGATAFATGFAAEVRSL